MEFTRTDAAFAAHLDAEDELASFRDEFVIDEPDVIYLDGNSLGRLPRRTIDFMRKTIEESWGQRLIRGWNEGWIHAPTELGAKIAQLIGAQADEVLVTESTSTNLFKLATAALQIQSPRSRIVSDVFNFPSDIYVLQGIIDLLGQNHQIELIPSADSISISPEAVKAALKSDTALLCLTHIAFKTAFMYDMAWVTDLAHQAGALVLWDLSHSVGAVPLDLNRCQVDLAIGCTYKYLNGGPGAPAFLYVRRDLQKRLQQPIWGWLGAKKPFAFDLDYEPADNITRYQVGTPPILSMKAMEPALDLLLEAGIDQLRAKSIQQTEYLIFLAEQWLLPLGFTIGTPHQSEQRGSHVALRHPESYRINRALIEAEPPAPKVIPDFREPDNIRLGITPLYTTFTEIHQALDQIRKIVYNEDYKQFSDQRLGVT